MRCPFSAHVRKTYPRDDTSSAIPITALNETTTQTRRMLRRGIPYGLASNSTPDHAAARLPPTSAPFARAGLENDRGLIFVAYETSLRASSSSSPTPG